MKMLEMGDFLLEAGVQMHRRDMSAYDGKSFECACGKTHNFNSNYMDYKNFGTTGANAKMIVACPSDNSYATLIHTKYKFIVIFDGFISLAGCQVS